MAGVRGEYDPQQVLMAHFKGNGYQAPALAPAAAAAAAQQRLDDALVAEGLDQHDAAVLHECLQVCSKTLEKSKPMKWLVQQCGVA
ncbi:hypothetical protein OEZ86_003849 [Tetradesmus obliquus]|nr:hypothetical protein OEZ86_003849 [Tetradesmus obliquus]